MLKELFIENLAVIEKTSISFGDKLNVFTGETGAGKSILINGINAILGQRTTKDIVRNGEKKATIVASFCNVSKNVYKLLEDYGFSFSEDEELIISRDINSDGGSTARINSRPVNLSLLKEVGMLLINVHGQHDSQVLLSPNKHIIILDSFGNLEDDLADYTKSFRELQKTARQVKELSINQKNKSLRIKELSEIIDEISSINILDNEDVEIEEEFNLSNNAVTLNEVIQKVLLLLSNEEDGINLKAYESYESLDEFIDIFSDLEPLSDRLKSVKIEVDDIASELSNLSRRLYTDPARFSYISDRRDALIKIKKKHGPELSDVLKKLDDSVKELELLTGDENSLDNLIEKRNKLLEITSHKAKELSLKRQAVSKQFIKSVTDELSFLNMPNVKLDVKIEKGKLTLAGLDNIEFLISANLGEDPKPIAKIASGGELSRIMLALKSVISKKDNTPTMIFDEIDTGVSGMAAGKIGIKLRQISRDRQVLCVTHLAQIAVAADNHFLIDKSVENERTKTHLKELISLEDREKEIARIMSGDSDSETSIKAAEEMLKNINNTC